MYEKTSYTMQILSPHHEKHKIGENFNNRKNDTPRGTLGPAEVEKNFCRNFANKLYIRSSYGVLITKNTKLGKILTIEKMTPQGGDPWTPKMLISQVLSFEPGHPYFLSIF